MHYNNNYKPPDKLVKKLEPYFISENSSSFSDWSKWSLVSFLEYAAERRTLSFNDRRKLHQRFGNSIRAILKSDAPANVKEAIKDFKNEVL